MQTGIDVNGRFVHYSVHGSKIPIVLIPPPLVGEAVFARQVEDLSAHFQMIQFNVKVYSQDVGRVYRSLAEDVLGILDHEGIAQAIVCGYSMGATVVFELMRIAQTRLLGAVILSGFSEVDNWHLKAEMHLAIGVASLRGMLLLSFVFSAANADSFASWSAMWKHWKYADAASVKALFSEGLTYNCTQHLRQMHTPVCLIYGGKDARLQSHAKTLHANLPNNELHIIHTSSHQLPLKHHEQLRDIIVAFSEHIATDGWTNRI